MDPVIQRRAPHEALQEERDPRRRRHQLRRRRGRAVRLPRPQRRRQDHHDLDPHDHPGQDQRHGHDRRPRPRSRRQGRPRAASGSSSRTRPSTSTCRPRRTSASTSPCTAIYGYRPFYRLMPAEYRRRVEHLAHVVGLERRPVPAAADLLGRHEAQARDHPQPHAPAGDPVPRRADVGPRPGQPQQPVALPARRPQRGRHDRVPDHPLPRGGRGGRPRVRRRPRPDRDDRLARPHEARAARALDRARRRRPRRRCSPSCAAWASRPPSTRPASSASPYEGDTAQPSSAGSGRRSACSGSTSPASKRHTSSSLASSEEAA